MNREPHWNTKNQKTKLRGGEASSIRQPGWIFEYSRGSASLASRQSGVVSPSMATLSFFILIQSDYGASRELPTILQRGRHPLMNRMKNDFFPCKKFSSCFVGFRFRFMSPADEEKETNGRCSQSFHAIYRAWEAGNRSEKDFGLGKAGRAQQQTERKGWRAWLASCWFSGKYLTWKSASASIFHKRICSLPLPSRKSLRNDTEED